MTYDIRVPKDLLEAAKMAEFLRKSQTDQATKFTDALLDETLLQEALIKPRKRRRDAQGLERFRSAVGALAADLLHHANNEASEGFMYRKVCRVDLATTLVSSRHLEQIVPCWLNLGWIERTGYFEKKLDFDGPTDTTEYGKARRMRAKTGLIEFAAKHGILPENVREHFPKQSHLISAITVRDERFNGKGKRLPSKNLKFHGPRFEELAEQVRELNTRYDHHEFSLFDTPRLYRLFHRGNFASFDYNMGGRLYCASEDNWQNRHKEERALIKIDGKSTVEIDIRASHLSILYALCGDHLDTEEDPYFIEGVERDVVKTVFTKWTGQGKPPVRWAKEFAKEYYDSHGIKLSRVYKLNRVVEALRDRHPVLEHLRPNSMDWARLQFEESECLLLAMLELSRSYEVPTLPVYDSLIVREDDADLVTDVLASTFERRLGYRSVTRMVNYN